MVFDPDMAPVDRDAFLAWFGSHNNDPEVFDPTRTEFSTPNLRSWFEDLLTTFPAMNGPYSHADQDIDDPHLTDYGIRRTHIYACFAWSMAESAYGMVMSLAERHGIAVYDVSDAKGRIWRPGPDGILC